MVAYMSGLNGIDVQEKADVYAQETVLNEKCNESILQKQMIKQTSDSIRGKGLYVNLFSAILLE